MIASQNKYKKWVLTVRLPETFPAGKFPSQDDMANALSSNAETWCFQLEKGEENGGIHYQCCFETLIRKRHNTLLNSLKLDLDGYDVNMIQLDRMQGSLEQAVAYCTKEDTRVEGSSPVKSANVKEAYKGQDIKFLLKEENRYEWQNDLFAELFTEAPFNLKDPDDRKIIWITDTRGNSGKSKFVKFCCFYNDNCTKVSFGSAGQLRSGLINTGAKQCYFIDIPRTLGVDDALNNVISAVEDLKNGYLTSNFHGAALSLMIEPPHIIVFSNMEVPWDKLSTDRWDDRMITNDNRLIGDNTTSSTN